MKNKNFQFLAKQLRISYNESGDKMKQDKKLTIAMALLFLFVFVIFGVIVTTEKLAPFYTKKIEEKFKIYIKENYSEIEKDLTLNEVVYKQAKYQVKVDSKLNKNLSFTLFYQDKKITDSYQKDYIEGASLLKKITKDIEKKTKEKTTIVTKVTMNKTLNNYTKKVRETLLKEETITNLKVYTMSLELTAPSLTPLEIATAIKNINQKLNNAFITPSHYNLTITDESDITHSIEINHLPIELIETPSFPIVINDIINQKENNIIIKNNITYQELIN